jgi:hypothetical protein
MSDGAFGSFFALTGSWPIEIDICRCHLSGEMIDDDDDDGTMQGLLESSYLMGEIRNLL